MNSTEKDVSGTNASSMEAVERSSSIIVPKNIPDTTALKTVLYIPNFI